jgi:hypothetical protein
VRYGEHDDMAGYRGEWHKEGGSSPKIVQWHSSSWWLPVGNVKLGTLMDGDGGFGWMTKGAGE